MSESLHEAVEAKFAHLPTDKLIARMNRAPDFGYDDEEVELTRRLQKLGQAWRWAGDFFKPSVEIYTSEAES